MWRASVQTFVGAVALIVIGALIVLGTIGWLLVGLLLPVFTPSLLVPLIGLVLWEARQSHHDSEHLRSPLADRRGRDQSRIQRSDGSSDAPASGLDAA